VRRASLPHRPALLAPSHRPEDHPRKTPSGPGLAAFSGLGCEKP
jgi:hypothetical protein